VNTILFFTFLTKTKRYLFIQIDRIHQNQHR